MYRGPGSRLIRAIARLVPLSKRADWAEEWRAELQHGYERRLANGEAAWLIALSLRLRCLGALRDAWWLRGRHAQISMVQSDVRMALRGMWTRPGFALAIVLTLALGIGGTTAMFSVIDPLMLRPLPYPQVHRLAEIHTVHPGGYAYAGIDVDVWRSVREALVPRVFERVEAGAPRRVVVTGAGEPTELLINAMTPGALALLGVRPTIGRLFGEEDAAPGAPGVVLLGERFWRRELLGDPTVLGKTIGLSGVTFAVIGVVPESFKYPMGEVGMWVPLRVDDPIWPVRGFEALVRLREGVGIEAAQAQVAGLASRLANEHPDPALWRLSVKPVEQWLGRGLANALGLLGGAVACMLLIACVNAANLLMVRGTSRQTELAIRRSLGATGGRLFQQLLTESLVIALTGGVLGVLLAYLGVQAIVRMMPDALVSYTQATIALDGRVLAFSLLLSLLTGVVFGAGPALRGARQSRLAGASERAMTASAAVRRAGAALVVAELALSMMLLVAAGLLTRSFIGLLNVEPGFRPRGVMVMEISLARHRYADTTRAEAFYRVLKERLRALPGGQGVTISDGVPPRPGNFRSALTLETESGEHRAIGELRLPSVVVDADYFEVLGIPLLAGRGFGTQDTRSSPPVVVIDPDLAALLWPAQSPVGRRFRLERSDPWLTVIGVAGDVKLMGPDDRASPYELYYVSSQQTPWIYRTVAVRTSGDPGNLAMEMRNTVRALDPEQPVLGIAPAESFFHGALERQRFVLVLMGAFTAIALILAALGVYGVISYLVAQRTREIGLRIALGATPRSMIGAVLRGGLTLAALGSLLGASAALALSRFLTGLLFGVQPTDAVTIVLVSGVLSAVAIVAALVPAARAGRVSPLQAMRLE